MAPFVMKTNTNDSIPPPQAIIIENKISPTLLLIIVILAVIFFVSGLLHLLVRYLLRPTNRNPEDFDNVTALQGQLQQLFHLHDSGVDQSFIDTLPVFLYKAITGGLKDPFDCAVCLCEFDADDKLRLLPKCSHAFHVECIDTWLLSHSTCPLCRGSLLDFPPNNGFSPVVLILESGDESSREIVERDPHVGLPCEDETQAKGGDFTAQVKLGKFRNVDPIVEGTSAPADGGGGGLGGRRCFSMGSFEYVTDETSRLQSEFRCESDLGKRDSFSALKVWHLPRNEKAPASDCSRRAFSFRQPGSDAEGGYGADSSSLARRTLLWLVGRQQQQSQVSHSSRVVTEAVMGPPPPPVALV
ncbi:RING-H2 finger protein ATL13 [Acorus calamus]|uniref:RING-type E3 ubiquitin transferase n=1 Tax=Acorus calamus TaxID=4465 RepID=A0AAV9EV71_ACOCL|nr:RING-H2 finger protein ATL13 [Acorus calamus]